MLPLTRQCLGPSLLQLAQQAVVKVGQLQQRRCAVCRLANVRRLLGCQRHRLEARHMGCRQRQALSQQADNP